MSDQPLDAVVAACPGYDGECACATTCLCQGIHCPGCAEVPRLRAEVERLQRERDAGWNGLANLYEYIKGKTCPREPDVALGMATSAVQQLRAEADRLDSEVASLRLDNERKAAALRLVIDRFQWSITHIDGLARHQAQFNEYLGVARAALGGTAND